MYLEYTLLLDERTLAQLGKLHFLLHIFKTQSLKRLSVGQGGTGNLQGFQAHHPLTYMGGGDSMVRTTLTIEKEVDDTRSIRDMGASAKRKENHSSSSSRKK